MRKIAILVGVLALAASTAHAEKGDKWFGVQGGLAVPTGDFKDTYDNGWNGSVYGSYDVAKNCAVGVEAGYHMFKANDDYNKKIAVAPPAGYGAGAEAKFSALQATAFTTYAFPMGDSKQKPYVKAGLGVYNGVAKVEGGTANPADVTDTNFGFNLGLGYNVEVSPMYSIGLNGAFHQIQTEGDAINMFTVGLGVNFGMAGGQ